MSYRCTRFAFGALGCCAGWLFAAAQAAGWDSTGHRAITLLALDAAAADTASAGMPGSLLMVDGELREMAAYQSSEADRYRAMRSPFLTHENAPDHYIDVEDLEPFGLTLDTVPPLRTEYLRAMAIAKHEHPEQQREYNPRTDPARTQEFPGYLPHAIVLQHAKLASAFRSWRLVKGLSEGRVPSARQAARLRMAEANIAHTLGHLSHFVGDAAQPLHTTRHYNGWVGENPSGFTVDKTFHAYIDGGVLKLHGLNEQTLRKAPAARGVDIGNPWPDVIAHIRRSFDQMRPLYELEKSGALKQSEGKAFITERLNDGAAMLAGLVLTAWRASEVDDKALAEFVKYDPELAAEGEPRPAESPSLAPGEPVKPSAPTPLLPPTPPVP